MLLLYCSACKHSYFCLGALFEIFLDNVYFNFSPFRLSFRFEQTTALRILAKKNEVSRVGNPVFSVWHFLLSLTGSQHWSLVFTIFSLSGLSTLIAVLRRKQF